MDLLSRRSRIQMGVEAFWRSVVSIMIPAAAVSVALFIDLDAASATATTKFKATSPRASIAYINSSSYIHDITTSDVSFGDFLNTLNTRQTFHKVGITKYTSVPRRRAIRNARKSGPEDVRWGINSSNTPTTPSYDSESCNVIYRDITQLEKCVCPNKSLGREVNCDHIRGVLWTFVVPQEVRVLSASHCNLSLPIVPESVENILSLNLSNNIISEVDNYLLGFSHLEILDLSINNLSSLNLSEVELPYLRILNAPLNKLRHFNSKSFRIFSLNLSSNNLFDTAFISNLIHLHDLDLSRNIISFIYRDTFKSLTQLQFLNLSHNRIEETSFIPHLGEKITIINLSNNSIKHIYARDLYSLQELNLGSNKISEINFSDLPKTLDTLNLSDNNISNISEVTVLNSQIVNLCISNNSLSDVKFIKYMKNLKNIDLSFNDLKNIDSVVFRNNKLHVQLNGTNLDSLHFTLNCDVRILNIENNNITCLPRQFFNASHNLREMYILNNPLDKLHCPVVSASHMKLLEMCDRMSVFHREESEVVIDMRQHSINNFLNCLLMVEKSRGKDFLKACYQECSGVMMKYISYYLLIVTYFLLTFL